MPRYGVLVSCLYTGPVIIGGIGDSGTRGAYEAYEEESAEHGAESAAAFFFPSRMGATICSSLAFFHAYAIPIHIVHYYYSYFLKTNGGG